MTSNGMKYCKDCEPAQEIHVIAYLSVVMGYIGEPFFNFMERLFKSTAEAISRKTSIPFLKVPPKRYPARLRSLS